MTVLGLLDMALFLEPLSKFALLFSQRTQKVLKPRMIIYFWILSLWLLVLIRALVVPLISGTRSVPRSLPKKGTRSVLHSKFEKRNPFRSSFLSKGTGVPFPFLCRNSLQFNEPVFLSKISILSVNEQFAGNFDKKQSFWEKNQFWFSKVGIFMTIRGQWGKKERGTERNFIPLVSGTRSIPHSSFEKRNAFPFRSSKKWNAIRETAFLECVHKALQEWHHEYLSWLDFSILDFQLKWNIFFVYIHFSG